jgi:peptide/nickel transport system substrate-binding protein
MIAECRACENFSSKMQGEKQILNFKLKKGLTFSDGTKVETSDIKKSWEYFAKNETYKSTFMGAFEVLENVIVKDNENVDFIFKSFSQDNLSNIALLKIIKIKNTKKENLDLNDIIGCGEYILQKTSPLEIVLKPRETNRPNIIFKVVKDETTLALKLLNKEVDLSVASMSPRKVSWLKEQKNLIQTWEVPSGNYVFLALNHKKEIFKDLRVRKALSLLIPRDIILKYKLRGSAFMSRGMFSPAFFEMYEDTKVDPFDPATAIKLLSEAGFEKNGKKLKIDWKVSNNKASIEIAEVIQDYFSKAGVEVTLTVQEWGTYMNSFKSGNFDVVMGQWVGFTVPDMLSFVYSSKNVPPKGGNRVSYKNSEVDQLLDSATTEVDGEKRVVLFKKAQKIIKSDYASIDLWHPNIIWIGSPCLKNIELVPTGSFDSLPKVEKNCDKR